MLVLLFFSVCCALPYYTPAPSSSSVYVEMPWDMVPSMEPQATGEAFGEAMFMPSSTPKPVLSPMPMMSPMLSPVMSPTPMMTSPIVTVLPTQTMDYMMVIEQEMKGEVRRDIGPKPPKEWMEAKRRAQGVGPKLQPQH